MLNNRTHLKRLLFNLESLVSLGQEVSSSKDLVEKMKSALYVVTGMFSVPSAALFIYRPQRKHLCLLVEKGHRDKKRKDLTLVVQASAIKTFKRNEPISVSLLAKTAFYRKNSAVFTGLQTRIFVPLFAKDDFVGAIALGKTLDRASSPTEHKDVLRVVAHQMAITLHNARLFLEIAKKASENKRLYTSMQRIYHDTIQAFAAAIDAKDDYTKDHSYRVASYAVAMARELEWKKSEIEGIYVAGLLHDIGKIIIDRGIINKGENLTNLEIHELKKHPDISYSILSKIKFPWKNIDYLVRHHHERVDGKGYPDALMSAELAEGVKILTLADAFDAMTTDRPYRRKMKLDEAFREVKRCCGTQFDEKVTETFFRILQRELNGEVRECRILPHLSNVDIGGFSVFEPSGDSLRKGKKVSPNDSYVLAS